MNASHSKLFWSTQSEIEFVKNICNRTVNGVIITRRQIIKKYLDSARLRKNWGTIDAEEVIHVLTTELKGEKE